MTSAAYLLNRPLTGLVAPWSYSDALFAAQRLDGIEIKMGIFAHCTFANISFKGCVLRDCHFIDCTFDSCYFRKSLLSGCAFDGCKFIDCDFPRARIQSSSFRFPRFQGTFLPFDEMKPNLPSEPELKALASAELAREAQASGHTRDARLYRIEVLRADESHLWAGFTAKTSWYKERYDTLDRINAGGRWALSQLNRFLWGNGERGVVLLRNFLLLTFLVFPLLFYALKSGLRSVQGHLTTIDYLLLSGDNVTGRSGFSGVLLTDTRTRIATGVELAIGAIVFGLFVTILFRRITRWRL